MNRLKKIRYYLFFVLLGFAAGCAGTGGTLDDWRDPDLTAVWPEPPQPPRIELLRVVGGDADLERKERNRFMIWLLGEAADEAPLISPYGITADGSGRVWVADPGGARVKIFDLARRDISYLGQAGNMPFVSPVDVAFDLSRQKLYVSDSGLGRVFVFDGEGRYEREIAPEEGFERPAGMAIDPDGNLYVVDVLKGVVEVFGPQAHHLRSVGSAASPDGLFRHPSNVAVDAQKRLYVVDSLRFRLEVQSADGRLISVIGQVGDAPGNFARPRGVAVDSYGHIYVSDAAFDNIQVFDLTGRPLLYFGLPGSDPGEFCLPAGLHVDEMDRIYVAESCNQRFQVFRYRNP